MKKLSRWLTLVLVSVGALCGAGAQAPVEKEPMVARTYRPTYITLADAVGVALEACAPTGGCETSTNDGLLRVVAKQGQQLVVAEALRKADVPPPAAIFTVHLFTDKPGPQDGAFPLAVKKALSDLKSVMPSKTYRLLDVAQFRSDGRASVTVGGLWLGMRTRPVAPGAREFLVDDLNLTLGFGAAPLLSTSLRIKLGETVVVGTARSHSEGETLVLVLTVTGAP